ncbi:MAG: DUF1697 domain-containing protein [Pseudomonadota bacterium]
MKYAAFFRNLNLGRTHCPNKIQFEAAFIAAGAETAASFLTNGTLVFSARTRASARKVLAQACQALQLECGLKEPAWLRSVDELAALVALDPFAGIKPGSVYACCISFLPTKGAKPPALPLQSARRDVEVIRFTDGAALSLSRQIGNTPGSPNAFFEKLLGAPATTRNWNTVVRLVGKHGGY